MEEEFKTIELQDEAILKDQVYKHPEFKTLIKVVGDNVVLDNILIYGIKDDFDFIIKVEGRNCIINNCRFHEISSAGVIISLEKKATVKNCLFIARELNDEDTGSSAIVVMDTENIILNNREGEK